MLKQSSGSGVMSRMTVNFSLLCSALAVALAAITGLIFNVLVPSANSGIFAIAIIVLFFTLFYAGRELFTTVNIALQDRDAIPGTCTSAFLGGSLLSFIAFLLALVTGQHPAFSFIAFVICIVSGGCLWLFINSDLARVKGPAVGNGGEPLPVPLVLPAFSHGMEASLYSPAPYNNPGVDRDKLPPLFKDDPLYQMPKPRRSSLFYVVKEREDACVISPDETRFVLSDGASASSLPRPWATLLGQQWINRPFGKTYMNSLSGWLEEPRNQWEQWVKEIWSSAVNERNRLTGDYPVEPEYLAQIIERGAFATLLGVQVDRQSQRWSALAIGDTCLFLVRRSSPWQILMSLPIERSRDFNNRPPLLSSRRDADLYSLLPYVKYKEGTYQEGDILLMATDALAQWLLLQKEQGEIAWLELLAISDKQSFARFVEKQRRDGLMEEDDTTLVVIPL